MIMVIWIRMTIVLMWSEKKSERKKERMNACMDGRNYGWIDRGMGFKLWWQWQLCVDDNGSDDWEETSDDCGFPFNYHHYGNDDNDYPWQYE